jgi:hypothetical protein
MLTSCFGAWLRVGIRVGSSPPVAVDEVLKLILLAGDEAKGVFERTDTC